MLQKESTIVDNTNVACNIASLQELERLEEIVEQGLKVYFEVGQALKTIQQQELYKLKGHTNFKVYCRDRFMIGDSRIYQLISACEIAQNLEPVVRELGVVLNESHCRELAKVETERQKEILEKVVEKSSGKLTAQEIKLAITNYELRTTNSKTPVPELNSIVRIVARHDLHSPSYKNHWGIVVASGEFSCDVRVAGNILKNLHPQYVLKCPSLDGSEPEKVKKLLNRLDRILKNPDIDYLVKIILHAISTGMPELTDWEERYLEFTEELLGNKSQV